MLNRVIVRAARRLIDYLNPTRFKLVFRSIYLINAYIILLERGTSLYIGARPLSKVIIYA